MAVRTIILVLDHMEKISFMGSGYPLFFRAFILDMFNPLFEGIDTVFVLFVKVLEVFQAVCLALCREDKGLIQQNDSLDVFFGYVNVSLVGEEFFMEGHLKISFPSIPDPIPVEYIYGHNQKQQGCSGESIESGKGRSPKGKEPDQYHHENLENR